jgi:hypothetical protein
MNLRTAPAIAALALLLPSCSGTRPPGDLLPPSVSNALPFAASAPGHQRLFVADFNDAVVTAYAPPFPYGKNSIDLTAGGLLKQPIAIAVAKNGVSGGLG